MIPRLQREIRKRPALLPLMLLALLTLGCGSGGGSGAVLIPDDLTASFVPSGSEGAPDLIRMRGSSTGDLVAVEVVLGGPTTSTDFYSFAFDLVLGDATVAEYVSGSATPGTALTTGDGQSLQVLAVQQGARVKVGLSKLGGGAGNGVAERGDTAIVELVFRVLRKGQTALTIEGSPGADPAAIDSDGAQIENVQFDAVSSALIGT